MSLGSATSGNANYTLSIPGVLLAPTKLEGWSTEDVVTTDRQGPVDVEQGIDGQIAAGFKFQLVRQTLTFLPNSISNDLFDTWWSFMQIAGDTFSAVGLLSLPSISKKWTLLEGSLTGYVPIVQIAAKLRPRQYELTWRTVLPMQL